MKALFFILFPLLSFADTRFIDSAEGRVMGRKLFFDLESSKTFFCECSFDKKGVRLEQKKCSITLTSLRPEVKMDYIVPISIYSKNFKEYYKGHAKCFTLGKKYYGAECVSLVNDKYKEMERDLHNIYPIEDTIISRIGTLKPSDITNGKKLDSCPMEVTSKNFMPTSYKKGWLARIYLYMDSSYPEAKILTNEEIKVLKKWDATHSPTKEECVFINKNNHLQDRQNKTLTNRCKEIKK